MNNHEIDPQENLTSRKKNGDGSNHSLVCNACRTPLLHIDAKRCSACGSFQGSRSWLNAINDVISPIGGAIALLGIASAMWIDVKIPDRLEVIGSHIPSINGLIFNFENTGELRVRLVDVFINFPPVKPGNFKQHWFGGIEEIRSELIFALELGEREKNFPLFAKPVNEFTDILPNNYLLQHFKIMEDEVCLLEFSFEDARFWFKSDRRTSTYVGIPCWLYAQRLGYLK